MKNTNVEVKKESNAILSKLNEDQFNQLRNKLKSGIDTFDEFYPTLNTELLTEIKNSGQMTKFEFLTEDEFISIVKDYGSVSHYRDEVRVITKVKVSLPNREELFPEKLVA